jgi:DUF971 family protein
MVVHPTQIRYERAEQLLHIDFSDDTSADYPAPYLRGYCPCARCQGHSAGPPQWIEITNERQITIEDVTQVGNYAVCIVWGDGHDTGIYTFQRLHDLSTKLAELPAHERRFEALS